MEKQLSTTSAGEEIRIEKVWQWNKGRPVVDRRAAEKGGETEEEVLGSEG